MVEPIRFDDGAAYERAMGVWSSLVGEVFLDWLAPASGLRWVDIGCGNGAFTETLIRRCAPAAAQGIDPSEGQIAFARSRPGAAAARFQVGDAMALPFEADSFDAAAMALVIFFVPDPARGLAEMLRVVRPGGLVAAYVWDVLEEGGFPMRDIQEELRAIGHPPPLPPSAPVSRMAALRGLWQEAGLAAVETRDITVERRFADFTEYWAASIGTAGLKPLLASLAPEVLAGLQARVRARLAIGADGQVRCSARANAIRGTVPGPIPS